MIRASAHRLFSNQLAINSLKRCYALGVTAETEADVMPSDWHSAKPYESIPGPTPWPIVGNAWRFIGGVDFLKIMKQMHNKYGDVVIMRQLLALGDMTMLFNIRDIEWLLRNEGAWPIRDGLASSYRYRHVLRKDVFGDTYGLINGQNESWGTFRTAVNPIMMQPRTTHQYIPQINEIGDEFIELVTKLKSKDANNETPDNFADELNKWAFESITAIALDTRLGVLAEKPSAKA
ncbi:cytochrome P450 12b1, mitochondrial-like, partial [Atheta coriaria]|uniref:cytochrome P450 12b1, mitochondrial-like n=1 Tax=Dalotia coriaria TaxID=877792 RepID=UPI0031F38391